MTLINTKRMFLERLSPADRDKHKPKYTMQEHDVVVAGVTYTSMYRLYIESVDEYDFITEHLGGMPLWHHLLNTQWFVDGYRQHRGMTAWREDLRARDESTAKRVLLVAAKGGDIPAAKKLLDVSRKPPAPKVAKTKQAELNNAAAVKAEDKDFLDNAALRLNVVSIRD
jgi:hypothetical protein